jgi:predicted acyl esterase
MWMRRTLAAAVVAAALGGSLLVQGQDADYVRANYTKFEFQVPMRDGVKLFTSVYVPKDRSREYPILMNRTPYSVAPSGRRTCSPRPATSSSTRTCAAG